MADDDGNGTIDVNELCTLMKKLGFSPNEDRVREIVDKVDHNQNGELEFDEFCEFLKIAKSGLGMENELAGQVQVLDKNGDGYVDAKDIREMMNNLGEHIGLHIPEARIDRRRAALSRARRPSP